MRLYTAGMPDPDLLIRTAGEMRVSNFLLWQISYAELWVTEKCWPDFDPSTLRGRAPRLRQTGPAFRRTQGLTGMLRTRLWMGAVLIALVAGVLLVDRQLGPWFPFFAGSRGRANGCRHLSSCSICSRRTFGLRPVSVMLGGAPLVAANWLPHWLTGGASAWPAVSGTLAAAVMAVFIVEMAAFHEPGKTVMRMALAVWLFTYVGLLPSYLAQLRWLGPTLNHSTAALALTIFVPKCADIGAYCTGRFLGRHRMTPVLSPKTWEGGWWRLDYGRPCYWPPSPLTGWGLLRCSVGVS